MDFVFFFRVVVDSAWFGSVYGRCTYWIYFFRYWDATKIPKHILALTAIFKLNWYRRITLPQSSHSYSTAQKAYTIFVWNSMKYKHSARTHTHMIAQSQSLLCMLPMRMSVSFTRMRIEQVVVSFSALNLAMGKLLLTFHNTHTSERMTRRSVCVVS